MSRLAIPEVLLESHTRAAEGRSFRFVDPVDILEVRDASGVREGLAEVERQVGRGRHAAGFVCYEAAAGLDDALAVREGAGLPLLWFALFRERVEVVPDGDRVGEGYALGEWQPSLSRGAYDEALGRIRRYIEAGDTYQVNYTFRLRAGFSGDPFAFYQDICRAQGGAFSAYVDLGDRCIMSASPELFIRLEEGRLTTRPMKGTRPRGRWPLEDEALAEELRNSPKDRAENVMIVDLLRNDLGRISAPGSVEVPRLWEVERYATVLQLTSTVQSRLREGVGLVELFTGLFPCGSITGAPKVRTMEIIAELEDSPRGIYTGCIGYISPGQEACFSVAIRTACLDRKRGEVEFGVGGGITWDSSSEGEFEECRVKSRLLHARRPEFMLLETLLYEEGEGYFLLDRHLDRLEASASYFGFSCDREGVRGVLERLVDEGQGAQRVRLLLSRNGRVEVSGTALAAETAETVWRAALADEPVDSSDPFLFHKTTHRRVYEARRQRLPGCDEVVLFNERGELTECCIGNLVLVLGGKKWTPPIACGLLGGTFRAELIDAGEIAEWVLPVEELERAEAVYMINSVRRWVRLTFESGRSG